MSTPKDARMRAANVLDYYRRISNTCGEEAIYVLADMLADLRHLCDDTGLDFERAARRSKEHFERER